MPTLSGLRRRGYTPEAIRDFCDRIGVAKKDSIVDIALLEHCVREDLNKRAPRVMAVLRPLRVVIENYPEGQVEELEAVNNPEDPAAGTRKVPFSRVLYIEQDDFRETPPPKYYRLAPGREVRLRYAYFVKCAGRGQGRPGQGGRAALHLRPGHPRRRRPGRPQGQGHHPLGLGRPRRPRRGAPVRPALPRREPGRRGRGAGLHRQSQPQLAGGARRAAGSSRAWPAPPPAASTSSSAWATSAWTPTPRGGRLVFNRTVPLKDEWAKIERSQRKG